MNDIEYNGPKRWKFLVPTLKALKDLGGSGRIDEIRDKIIENLALSDEIVDFPHGDGSRTKVEYEFAWARTLLKSINFLENTSKGVWVLTKRAQDIDWDENQVELLIKSYRKEQRELKKGVKKGVRVEEDDFEDVELEGNWREKLMKILKSLNPYGFEKLAQRVLRESGFTNVKITKHSHDGGLDGEGVLKLNNLISVPIIFECKRYKDPVGAKKIRNFRGAMGGRVDRGLFITTSTFTHGAIKESRREGAKLIDLINGEQFIDILKDLKFGLKIEEVEKVTADEEWFKDYQ